MIRGESSKRPERAETLGKPEDEISDSGSGL